MDLLWTERYTGRDGMVYVMEDRIRFFKEMLASVTNIYFTILDADYNILSSDAAHLEVFMTFFRLAESYDKMVEQGRLKVGDKNPYLDNPVVCTNSVGMAWLSDIVYEGNEISRIHILGPVFLDDYSVQIIDEGLERLKLSVKMRHQFMDIIKQLPVISLNHFYEYGIMLHYCLTGRKIGTADFIYADDIQDIPEHVLEEKHGAYMVETNILKLVEEGNLSYEKEMEKFKAANVGKFAAGDYLRQAKNSVIIFCGLCARAAIRGGVAPETAYLLRDRYVQNVEDAKNLAVVNKLNRRMLGDYIHRVHSAKSGNGISSVIRESCDYIVLHIKEKCDIHFLASRVGYADYYFSEKFRKETGQSVRDYVITRKIEKAKEYLVVSNMSIQRISDELGFNSQSYFARVFRQETGESPMDYRKRNQE